MQQPPDECRYCLELRTDVRHDPILGSTWVEPKSGRLVARKAGPKTRTRQEMEALGYTMLGNYSRRRFRIMLKPSRVRVKTPLLDLFGECEREITEGEE